MGSINLPNWSTTIYGSGDRIQTRKSFKACDCKSITLNMELECEGLLVIKVLININASNSACGSKNFGECTCTYFVKLGLRSHDLTSIMLLP